MSSAPTPETISRLITTTLKNVYVHDTTGDYFFSCDPALMTPFVTIVTHDNEFDHLSKLDRDGVFRLNMRTNREHFRELFPLRTGRRTPATSAEQGYDFTALDVLMPHPIYGRMHWVCVLNPSAETVAKLMPLIAEAHAADAQRQARRS